MSHFSQKKGQKKKKKKDKKTNQWDGEGKETQQPTLLFLFLLQEANELPPLSDDFENQINCFWRRDEKNEKLRERERKKEKKRFLNSTNSE